MAYKQIPDFVINLIATGLLKGFDVRVYCVLLFHTSSNRGDKGRLVWPGYRTIAAAMGNTVSNKRIAESIKRLVEVGAIVLLNRGGGRGRANTYFLPMEPLNAVQNVPHKNAVQNVPRCAVQNVPRYAVQNVPRNQKKELDVLNQGNALDGNEIDALLADSWMRRGEDADGSEQPGGL